MGPQEKMAKMEMMQVIAGKEEANGTWSVPKAKAVMVVWVVVAVTVAYATVYYQNSDQLASILIDAEGGRGSYGGRAGEGGRRLAFALTDIGESAIRTEMEGFFLEISNALKEKEVKEANRVIIVPMVFGKG